MDFHPLRNCCSKKVKDDQQQTFISWWSKWTQILEAFKKQTTVLLQCAIESGQIATDTLQQCQVSLSEPPILLMQWIFWSMLKQGTSLSLRWSYSKTKEFGYLCCMLNTVETSIRYFLPAFGSGGKEERITKRPFFFLQLLQKGRKSGRQADHPFFPHLMQKERMSGQQTDRPFFLQSMQWERKSGW